MPGHPEPQRLTDLATAVGGLGRVAGATGEDLLDSLVMVGDHGTQRAVDDAVDAVVAVLREIRGEAQELAHVLGSTGARAASRERPPDPVAQPRPVEDHVRGPW